MEGRLLLSAASLPPTAAAAALQATAKAGGSPSLDAAFALQVTGVTLTDFNKQINVQGTIGGASFDVPISSVTTLPSGDPLCPTLLFELDPQSLDYSGFSLDFGPICVAVTPEHQGDATQKLFCNIGELLTQGNELGNILTGVVGSGNGDLFTQGLVDVLNAALGGAIASADFEVSSSGALEGKKSLDTLTFTIEPYSASFGDFDIDVDNCAGGDVVITLVADATEGKKLRNALHTLDTLLNSNASEVARGNALNKVAKTLAESL
jgi:hypothetical protein